MRRDEIVRNLVAETRRLRGDLDAVRQELDDDLGAVAARAFPEADPGLRPRAIVGARDDESLEGIDEFDAATMDQRQKLLEAGVRALDKIDAQGEQVQLDATEEVGLEAIVRFSLRPALLVTKGRFADPPPPWGVLEDYREGIETSLQSIGRIQVPGMPDRPYAGTGFLVADDVLMTNCHVARIFSALGADSGWKFKVGVRPGIDFVENPDANEHNELVIEEVIGVHRTLDLALLRVTPAGAGAPKPLTLSSEEPENLEGRQVYAVGYPAPDSARNDPVAMRQVFGEIYYVKRLQPGTLLPATVGPVIAQEPCSQNTRPEDVIYHDASTLGGNSGSAVVDLENNVVIGLHYGGLYTRYNQAVALWKLTDDPLLTKARVKFD